LNLKRRYTVTTVRLRVGAFDLVPLTPEEFRCKFAVPHVSEAGHGGTRCRRFAACAVYTNTNNLY
jgi:hypothetical protein